MSTICTEQPERRALSVRVAWQEQDHLHNFSVLAAFFSSSRGVKVLLIDTQIIFLGLGMPLLKRGIPLFEQEHLERATCLSSLCHIIF